MKKVSQSELSILNFLRSIKTTSLPEGLKIANSEPQINKIEDFRERLFGSLYPEMKDFHDDLHDAFSLILFTENKQGDVISTARVVFDSPAELPADEYANTLINERRNKGQKLVEISRFAIADEAKDQGLLPIYYQAFYSICVDNNIDSMIIIINSKSVKFHQKRIGAELLIDDIGHNYGCDDLQFSCMDWVVSKTKPQFLKWAGLPAYTKQQWDEYSRLFASVLTNVQRELYLDACQYLSGKVIDLGCGPARLAGFLTKDDSMLANLADKQKVSHYTGIEYAHAMVKIAKFTLQTLSRPNFSICHQKITDVDGQFTSAVSLQSYYAWDKPEATLAHIFKLLLSGSIFVLATANKKLDQKKLFKDAELELMWHPDFEAFKKMNFKFSENPQANFVSMDELIKQVQLAGFEVINCHQKHYVGGLNFLVCKKPTE